VIAVDHDDHLAGKPENVREFGSCRGKSFNEKLSIIYFDSGYGSV